MAPASRLLACDGVHPVEAACRLCWGLILGSGPSRPYEPYMLGRRFAVGTPKRCGSPGAEPVSDTVEAAQAGKCLFQSR
jgi:hypothetical protein